MIQLAFKLAASTSSPIAHLIARETGSIYCHVEGWLSGPANNARCFSAREPHGAGFQQIDLTVPGMWELIPLHCTPEQEAAVNGFCYGCDGKYYDNIGVIGYALANPEIHDYSAVFCSEVWAAIAEKCLNKRLPKLPWMISPGALADLAKGWEAVSSIHTIPPIA